MTFEKKIKNIDVANMSNDILESITIKPIQFNSNKNLSFQILNKSKVLIVLDINMLS